MTIDYLLETQMQDIKKESSDKFKKNIDCNKERISSSKKHEIKK